MSPPSGWSGEKADQLTDGVMAVLRMAKRELVMDLVTVAASMPCLRQVAGLLEVLDQLGGGPFRDAHRLRDVSEARAWIGGEAYEHMRVVGDEPPGMITITGSTFHER